MNQEESTIEARSTAAVRSWLLLLSALLGAAAAYLVFVLFLQTEVVSSVRLGLAGAILLFVAVANYLASVRWLAPGLFGEASHVRRAFLSGLILVAAFLPLLYQPPSYPRSPLLRPWTDLAIQFDTADGETLTLVPSDLKLVMGHTSLDTSAFQLVGNWHKIGNELSLSPGQTGSLQWTGTVPGMLTLSISPPGVDTRLTVYWDGSRTAVSLPKDSQSPVVIVQKMSLPWGYSLLFFASLFVLAAWAFGLLGIVLERRLRPFQLTRNPRFIPAVVGILSVCLAILTVKLQIDSLGGGMDYVNSAQLMRHTNVMRGLAPDPWQYRVLSEWVAELFVRLFGLLPIPNAAAAGFVALRLGQNIAIFLLAFALYRRISGADVLGVLGILVLAASMHNAYYDNDLSFNTYFDLSFYLLCALLLLSRNYTGVVILMVFAALNRETSALIPFLMAAAMLEDDHKSGLSRFLPAVLAAAVFAAVFFGLRWIYPARPLYVPYKHPAGISLLLYNVSRQFTWNQLFGTLGMVPLIGLLAYPFWPRLWQRFLWIVCPIWFLIHSFASVMAETRLFLVPQALVLIPGMLFLLMVLVDRRPAAILLPELDVRKYEPR